MSYWDTKHEPVVYYMVHAHHKGAVKIGTTVNMKQRLAKYRRNRNNEEYIFVAIEPGGTTLESQRHLQFKNLLINGDWFFYAGDLQKHIEALMQRDFNPESQGENA